jgi:uncharacterized SAM-binding protein YcdF (DUF218 family)
MTRERNSESNEAGRPRRRHPVLRLLLTPILIYAGGFALWTALLPSARASDDATADAIVALTGEGDRLAPAVALLEMGNGARLLITGVNKQTSKTALKHLLNGGPSFDCCVDLGFAAADTRGNAVESAAWVRGHHYRSLIVVTAAYHMPRSLLEFSAQMPDVTLVPFPVAQDETNDFSWTTLRRLNGEYAKFLASWVRVALLKPARDA